jgi:hypothetical protein
MTHQTTAPVDAARRPVVTWLLQTFAPEFEPEVVDTDRYALVEQGIYSNTVRFLADATHAGPLLTDEVHDGYGITGTVRIFDLGAPLDACELTCRLDVDVAVAAAAGHAPREIADPPTVDLLPAKIAVSLEELGFDVETLNDIISERVTGSCAALVGFAYRPVAVTASGGIILEVTGDIDLDDYDDERRCVLRAHALGDDGQARFRRPDGTLGDLAAARRAAEREIASITVPDGFEWVRLPATAAESIPSGR